MFLAALNMVSQRLASADNPKPTLTSIRGVPVRTTRTDAGVLVRFDGTRLCSMIDGGGSV